MRPDGLNAGPRSTRRPRCGEARPSPGTPVRRMREASAAAGTAAFFILAPGVVAGLVPWCNTGWTVAEARSRTPVGVVGAGLLAPPLVERAGSARRAFGCGRDGERP